MSKRNLLKSVIAMVMAGFILSLSSCQKDEKRIIGKWKTEKMEISDFATTDPLMTVMLKPMIAEYMGMNDFAGQEMEFTKDGRIITGGSQVGTYRVSDGKLFMTSDGREQSIDIVFPDKKSMQWNQNVKSADLAALSMLVTMMLEEEVEITKFSTRMTFKKL